MAKGEGAESVSSAGLLQPSILKPEELVRSKRESKAKLSICSKVCYAIGGAPYQITGCALGFFLQIYLLDVVQMDPFYASIILFVGRAWDAITDPLVGFFISKSSWTCFGRLMPWIVFSTPFGVISYFMIWLVPDISQGQVMWYLFFYCIFQTLVTCFHVPYSALTMFISREQSERDSATAYRMTVEVLGTVLGTAIQGQIVGRVDIPCIPDPPFLNMNNSSVVLEEVNITRDTGSLSDTRNAYMIAAGVIGGIYILCATILSLGVRERQESSELQLAEPVSFFQGLKLVMKHGPYIKLIAAFLFTSLAFMLLEGNFALFCTYTLGFRNEFQNILLAIMLSATLTIPLWQWFLIRFGKKTAVYIGISSATPFLISVVILESNLVMTYVVAVAAGMSVAAAFLLPW
ncbi:sodium-dependent lysophosphatidylcholine symporter 1 isoform X1 [Notechis scutatus]|uniref:Sodium-dependent lysophosphatidylcholine symporter 1 isoform X1 n=1 Tax=Notechis scutatus TaxID=8663 RepID=A0A6J1UZL9_9SAUR|nr:sodium-dependent lysophosphatidylcholine symporter 1 isoform X1 [Notechis scutatus]